MRLAMPALKILAFSALIVIPALAAAQCTDLFENLATDSNYWFGLRHDGANMASAQSFTLDCAARIEEVRFELALNSAGGVPALTQGDVIDAAIMNDGGGVLATAQTTVTHASGTGWVIVDFTGDDTVYPVGSYRAAIGTSVEAMGSLSRDTTDGFDGGRRYATTSGIDGSWSMFSGEDLKFRVVADTDVTAADPATLSAVKSLY